MLAKFLEDMEESFDLGQIWPKNKNRCQIAFRYTKLKLNNITLTFIR